MQGENKKIEKETLKLYLIIFYPDNENDHINFKDIKIYHIFLCLLYYY